MDNLEPKKLLLLRILQVLEDHSSADHPLRQKDIIRLYTHLSYNKCMGLTRIVRG